MKELTFEYLLTSVCEHNKTDQGEYTYCRRKRFNQFHIIKEWDSFHISYTVLIVYL